ncbi:MAG: M20/M25/M40 family metallo-hydrolase [Acidobacteria bacterium]|nr:M20/M25/M40 family metallo-hydrolase [Acidobacteriota bacterium]
MSTQPDFAKHIHAEELAELALKLANTFSPAGHEQAMAEVVQGWFEQNKIPAYKQPILADRANVIATLKGSGGGASLILNSHMDTEVSGPDYDGGMAQPDLNKLGATREGDRLFGHTVLNDRGLMATTMMALKALRDSGVPLRGDVIFTAVAGETGSAPVDEFQGLTYEGKGLGSRFLVSHGVRADYALVAETTDFGLSWIACGACYFKVIVSGRNMYTPRSFRPDDVRQHPNAIVKMARVIEKIEAWARQYEASRSFDSACGHIVPRISIGAIRGGIPYRPNRSSPHCAIYVDVRTVPGEDPLRVEREIEAVVTSAEVGARVETFLARSGVEGKNVERLAAEVRRCYKQVAGQEPLAKAPDQVVSMWRDINVFNAAGIPSLTFGCARRQEEDGGRLYFDMGDLVATATIYAQVAHGICDKPVKG